MNSDIRYDAVVVGGGFAGVIAARDLAHAGRSVLLLEARDRLGGRAWTSGFAGTDMQVEMGGAWVAPKVQHHVAANVDRYGLQFSKDKPQQTYGNLIGGVRVDGAVPVPGDELFDLERAWVHMWNGAARIDPELPLDAQPGLEDLDVSWHDFLAPLNLPAATWDYLNAWQQIFGGRAPGDWSALHFLHWFALMGNSPLAIATALDTKIAGGTRSLLEAIVADARVEVRLNSPVASVEQDDAGVRVTGTDGAVHMARVAVIALPANLWDDVRFSPPLNAGKQAAARDRANGYAVKTWAIVADAPPFFMGMGSTEDSKGLVYLSTDRETEDGQLIVGFSVDPDNYDVGSREHVERTLQAYMPGCRVVAFDGYDWNADPYSKGTWAAYPPGMITNHLSDMRRPEGRLVFATSDIARTYAGWLDGALESGADAAQEAAAVLSGDEVAAS
jgi:monoamine oxidase